MLRHNNNDKRSILPHNPTNLHFRSLTPRKLPLILQHPERLDKNNEIYISLRNNIPSFNLMEIYQPLI